MLRRITDLWPDLLRTGRDDQSDAEEPLLPGEGDRQDDGQPLRVDEGQLLEDYRHLYWTRLMVIEDFELGQEGKWPMRRRRVEFCSRAGFHSAARAAAREMHVHENEAGPRTGSLGHTATVHRLSRDCGVHGVPMQTPQICMCKPLSDPH